MLVYGLTNLIAMNKEEGRRGRRRFFVSLCGRVKEEGRRIFVSL